MTTSDTNQTIDSSLPKQPTFRTPLTGKSKKLTQDMRTALQMKEHPPLLNNKSALATCSKNTISTQCLQHLTIDQKKMSVHPIVISTNEGRMFSKEYEAPKMEDNIQNEPSLSIQQSVPENSYLVPMQIDNPKKSPINEDTTQINEEEELERMMTDMINQEKVSPPKWYQEILLKEKAGNDKDISKSLKTGTLVNSLQVNTLNETPNNVGFRASIHEKSEIIAGQNSILDPEKQTQTTVNNIANNNKELSNSIGSQNADLNDIIGNNSMKMLMFDLNQRLKTTDGKPNINNQGIGQVDVEVKNKKMET